MRRPTGSPVVGEAERKSLQGPTASRRPPTRRRCWAGNRTRTHPVGPRSVIVSSTRRSDVGLSPGLHGPSQARRLTPGLWTPGVRAVGGGVGRAMGDQREVRSDQPKTALASRETLVKRTDQQSGYGRRGARAYHASSDSAPRDEASPALCRRCHYRRGEFQTGLTGRPSDAERTPASHRRP